ncbi:hypothetical protein I4U23_015080 [Adineta vaga]|nr:hypothetical protein I4U23_015080 [Adineta vaga]
MYIHIVIFIFLTLSIQNVSSTTVISASNETCYFEHNGEKLQEGDIVDIKGKLYKFEDCELHRAYHVCGTHIITIINIVCQALYKEKSFSTGKRYSRFVRQKLLTEACCQSFCTVSEMSRYCP